MPSQSSQQNLSGSSLFPSTSIKWAAPQPPQCTVWGAVLGRQPALLNHAGPWSNHEPPWHSPGGLDIPWGTVWACRQESVAMLLTGFATRGSVQGGLGKLAP